LYLVPVCIGSRRHNDSGPVKPNSGIDLHQVAAHGASRRRPLRAARCDRPYDSSMPSPCRFPPPWSIEEPDPKLDRRCFIVRDANGQALAYVYFEEGARRRRSPSYTRNHQRPSLTRRGAFDGEGLSAKLTGGTAGKPDGPAHRSLPGRRSRARGRRGCGAPSPSARQSSGCRSRRSA
jgi:hypothetical protein